MDNTIDEEELIAFFKNEFSSVKSSKIIRDAFSGKSKGFGFVNLQDFKEYMQLLKLNKPLILKGQLLTIK